ncbi:putative spermidine/putrescine transport system substrate-binding protein [Microbacterium proteolyticum]|uniref:Putative spermidine/putrescine transport system substrate-binding protein n=1 Tax=Microbacterium proteolyticum TaxID=1572644 RepID=A0A7W5CGR0_9MICO|nr:ABC transporter substrate-binding protein [Microbacterium proteolyticum]MBB3157353.1 putative spermidine/putrescine transport system substrate-binding protein [Microbacterium proteolyticum]
MSPLRRRRRVTALTVVATSSLFALAGCAAPATPDAGEFADWDAVLAAADGQTVQLWMYGGDDQGNAYVDDILAPAVAAYGVTLERVPVTDTRDALNRVFTELQAGRDDGSVDLVWVNGDNFRTGKEAGAWRCGWTSLLPSMTSTSADDPLLQSDFGTPVDGCEAPWHKAQFTLAYNAEAIADPPTTLAGVLDWAEANPGRFTYPAPPDFTGSVFVREALASVSGGSDEVPTAFSQEAYDELAPALWERLDALAPSLWRAGDTYPANETELGQLFADRQVDMTMTYGPATLTGLVADGTYPAETRVLTLDDGTVGNASFLGLPVNSDAAAGAMVVANVALSVEQQAKKAEPGVWGQFPVLDLAALPPEDRALFDALPDSPVVPPYDELSRNAHGELAAEWVPALDDGWRQNVLSR